MTQDKKVSILGSTGSIGTQALDIIKESNRFKVVALTCNAQIDKMIAQAEVFNPELLVVFDENQYDLLVEKTKHLGCRVACGMAGLVEAATIESADVVLTSVVGNIGLIPTVEAIKAKKDIALANKETLVTAGSIIMPLAKEYGVQILPVDSEHSAIFQCLNGENYKAIDEILLTASGGAFRNFTREEIAYKKAVEALKHPNWAMGRKITIDSATLMNKGLEFIEAKWLFDVEPEQIKVVVHPQSIIHSMVRFKDQSVISQMGLPDMKLPIIYALDYPVRHHNTLRPLDFYSLSDLSFSKPDLERFPCLRIAIEAIQKGGSVPTVMNAANEVLVAAYLDDKIGFYDIPKYIEKAIDLVPFIENPSLDDILTIDKETRTLTVSFIS